MNSEIFGLQADIHDLMRDIGYVPETSFREGIVAMIHYKERILM